MEWQATGVRVTITVMVVPGGFSRWWLLFKCVLSRPYSLSKLFLWVLLKTVLNIHRNRSPTYTSPSLNNHGTSYPSTYYYSEENLKYGIISS